MLHFEKNLTSVRNRTTIHIHYGTGIELEYTIRNDVVPARTFPVNVNGNIWRGVLKAWFRKHGAEMLPNQRVAKEINQPRPGLQDALFGKA